MSTESKKIINVSLRSDTTSLSAISNKFGDELVSHLLRWRKVDEKIDHTSFNRCIELMRDENKRYPFLKSLMGFMPSVRLWTMVKGKVSPTTVFDVLINVCRLKADGNEFPKFVRGTYDEETQTHEKTTVSITYGEVFDDFDDEK